uniref:Uncharacterized protein n=1 Tax=Mycena chlorophos TaxID=658473 RepID=A0ABQ0KWS1_MYCCL|nr:predicted protein [Mycena chlorophos]
MPLPLRTVRPFVISIVLTEVAEEEGPDLTDSMETNKHPIIRPPRPASRYPCARARSMLRLRLKSVYQRHASRARTIRTRSWQVVQRTLHDDPLSATGGEVLSIPTLTPLRRFGLLVTLFLPNFHTAQWRGPHFLARSPSAVAYRACLACVVLCKGTPDACPAILAPKTTLDATSARR